MAGLSQWILDNQAQATGLTISSLAQQTGVSETTVFRFCKMLGLKGYKDLRFALAEGRGLALGTQLAGTGAEGPDPKDHRMSSIMRRVIDVNTEQLLKTASLVPLDALQQASDLIVAANHIHLVGFGSSAPVAFDAYQRFLALGLTASAHSDPHILAAVTATVRPGALFLGISCSGLTRDITDTFESAGTRGLKRIAITSNPNSPVAAGADVVLVSAVRRSPVSMDVISTRISQLSIIEMICVALAENYAADPTIMHDTKMIDQEIAKKRVPVRDTPPPKKTP
ncbi:MurR/RpiR family transcriptional regulator [Ruegeria halocynthiae]|nr:MurR/RpiR family transcriptional regulator [Ruegeria halocynthiae]